MRRIFIGIFILSTICFNSGCELNSPVHFIADNAECKVRGETSSESFWDRYVTFDDNFFPCSPNTEFELWVTTERLTIKSKDGRYQNNFKLSYNREKTYDYRSSIKGVKAYYFSGQSDRYRKYKSEVIIQWTSYKSIWIRCITYFDDEVIKKTEDEMKDYLKGEKLKEVTIEEEYIKDYNENIYNQLSYMLNQL